MADVEACGAWADKTTPEWAHGGKVTCERPSGGRRGHDGPHSARKSPPTGGKPVTLTWVQDARPAGEQPADESEAAAAASNGRAGDLNADDLVGAEGLLLRLSQLGVIPERMAVSDTLRAMHALEGMLDEGWRFVPPEDYVP